MLDCHSVLDGDSFLEVPQQLAALRPARHDYASLTRRWYGDTQATIQYSEPHVLQTSISLNNGCNIFGNKSIQCLQHVTRMRTRIPPERRPSAGLQTDLFGPGRAGPGRAGSRRVRKTPSSCAPAVLAAPPASICSARPTHDPSHFPSRDRKSVV